MSVIYLNRFGFGLFWLHRKWSALQFSFCFLFPVFIFLIGPGILFDLLVFDVPYFVGDLVHKVSVVGDGDKTSFVLLQGLDQDILRDEIEVVGRLVQQQEVGF